VEVEVEAELEVPVEVVQREAVSGRLGSQAGVAPSRSSILCTRLGRLRPD